MCYECSDKSRPYVYISMLILCFEFDKNLRRKLMTMGNSGSQSQTSWEPLAYGEVLF